MTAQLVFDKTLKGQEEIATRRHGLPSRLRSLLVLIDGKTNVEGLVRKVSGLGLNEQSIAELLERDFIAPHEVPGAKAPAAKAAPPAAPSAPESAPQTATQTATPPTPHAPQATSAPSEATSGAGVLPEGESQFQALYHFYTTTIKSTLGLRGFTMQLKVERCASIDDFRALKPAYIEAVQKSKGDEMALSLAGRLDQLLNLK